ncbi:hypothetical protein [Mucilaginibacter psychrotolerans]|uniref:Uncharacterized protein n=1 Tax=Mucilaginibacter psychrotolerans TaxID=1524096 RepID=A0A4Y8S6Y4_9SPHI|nr:hypothetical protein [Mucilaginibacter psychrotolerans]TFF34773.1 hypothetical protein E2R66_21230 [Mucilaginibacter psychrotolerans]
MRTLLTEIQQIDEHVQGSAAPDEALLFEAKLLLDAELPLKVQWHKQTLGLVQQYGRKNLVSVINDVHTQLLTQPQHQSFRQKIMGLFR